MGGMPRTAWSPGQRLLTAGLAFMVTAAAFEGLAVPTVMPDALDELGGLTLYGWAFSGFWLANLVGISIAGAESDRAGPTRPLLAGTAAFAVGLAAAALAPSMELVVVARIVQGLGAGAISAVTYFAIARGYDAGSQPQMIAVLSSAWVLPGLLGPLIAGIVAEQLSWRWVFGGLAPLLPVVALAVAVAFRRLPEPAGEAADDPRSTTRDAFLLAAGAGLVLWALTLDQPLPAVATGAVGLLIAARPLQRLLPDGTLRAKPGRGAAIAAIGLVSIGFLGAETFVPLSVSSVRNAGVVVGGLSLTAAAVTWASGSWVQARLASRGIRQPLVAAGFILVLAGIALVTSVPLTGVPIWMAPLAWAVAGLGMGLAYSTLTLVAIETAPAGAEGAAASAIQLANTLGIAVGTGVAGGLVALVARGPGIAPGIGLANLVMILACGVGLLVVRRLPRAGRPGPTRLLAGEHGPSL